MVLANTQQLVTLNTVNLDIENRMAFDDPTGHEPGVG
jgi:hypothetical protein